MIERLRPKELAVSRRVVEMFFTEAAPANPMVKLPNIPVPKFNGDIKQFTEWFPLFDVMINSNENLKPIQKLYFLKQAMVDNVRYLLQDFRFDDGMYENVFQFVKKYFTTNVQ